MKNWNWHDWEKPYQSGYNVGEYIFYYGFSAIPDGDRNCADWKTANIYWYMPNSI